MKQGGLREALLATSSALALVIGAEGAAQAQCAINNQNGAINNTTTINCISFNNGATFSGPVTNASTGTINAAGATPPTETGISVIGNSTLTGSITNAGTITAVRFGIDIGLAGGGSVGGSIINNNSITAPNAFFMRGGTVAGSITNNASINSTADVGLALSGTSASRSSVGGSVTNNGTITSAGTGIFTRWLTVGGSIVNALGATIDSSNGFAGIEIVNSTMVGSMVNNGTITLHSGNSVGMFVDATGLTGPGGKSSVAGSVVNNGTINAVFGMGVSGSTANPTVITGDVFNSGTINASKGGISIAGATIGGNITNTATGRITAAAGVGIFVTSSSTPGGTSVTGGIVNQGSITAKTGIAVGGLSTVAGGITNNGNITASGGPAIDLATQFGGEGAAMVINQQGGTITGDILLSSLGDTVNVTGGSISGNIVGQSATGTVNFALGAGHAFTYSNSITGVNTVNVNSGTLFDNNSITATTVNVNGGALAPGLPGTIGTLTITGNLVFASAATYLVMVNPSSASFTTVSGNASLAGTVQAVFAPGSYVSRSYDILHSASLGGTTFSGVTSNMPGLAASLSYTPTDVLLNLTAQLGLNSVTGLSQNQQAVANAINAFFNNGGALPPGFISLFGLSGSNLANALTLLSGETATGSQQGAFQLMSQFLGLMLDPFIDGRGGVGGANGGAIGFAPEQPAMPEEIALAYASVLKAPVYKATPFEQRWTAWGSAYGGYNRTSGDPVVVGSHDLTARAGGFAAGMDYHFTRDAVLGFALAGGGTNWTLAQGLGGGKSDAFQAGVYGTTRWGPAYVAASLAYTNHWMSTDRFAFAGDHLTASFNAQSVGARVESGYRVITALGALTPYAAVQAQSFRTPSYSETDLTNGGFGLAYAGRTATDTRSELGARYDNQIVLDRAAVLALRARLAWAHDWVSDPTLAAVFQALPGAGFIVNGATPAKDSALASAGAELRLANGVTFLGKLDGEFAHHSSTYSGTGTVRVAW
jgi:outer membrane autotransporter protein